MLFVRFGVLMAVAAGCTFARTQTVIEVRADGRVMNEADEVRFEVRDGFGVLILERVVATRTSDFRGFPMELPVAAKNGQDSRTFEVRAAAIVNRRQPDGSVLVTTLAQNRVRTGFRRGQILRFSLWLLSGCLCIVETERCEPDADGDLVPECVAQTRAVEQQEPAVDAATEDARASDSTATDVSLGCSVEQRVCNGRCVPLNSPNACGPSCTACEAFSGGTATCDNDVCGIVCGSNTPDRCPGACVNLESDRVNCGSCGNVCPTNQPCVRRQCQAPPQCTMPQDPACPGGTYCNLETRLCVPGCDGRSGQCPANTVCNLQTSTCDCNRPNRMCGTACAACPSDANATDFACSGQACVIAACRAGFAVHGTGTGCVSRNGGLFSGAPIALVGLDSPTNPSWSLAVSADGTTVVIGNPSAGQDFEGSVTVYTRNGDTWIHGANMQRPTGARDFGASVSLSSDGGTLAVGDWQGGGDRNGAVTVYARSAGTWSNGTNIPRPSGASEFGHAVSLSSDGRSLAVGSPGEGVLVYTRSGDTWSNGVAVWPPASIVSFGATASLSSDGRTLMVGDPFGGGDFYGWATVYTANNGWTSGVGLQRPSGARRFGQSASLSSDGRVLVVGDPGDSSGAATVYERVGDAWSSGTVLLGSFDAREFGDSVSLSADGRVLVVGDPEGGGDTRGAVTAYERVNAAWVQRTRVQRPNLATAFGRAVSLSSDGSVLVVAHLSGVSAYLR